MAVNKTFLADSVSDSELVAAPYVIFRQDRQRNGGGVMIAAKDTLNPVRALQYEHDNLDTLKINQLVDFVSIGDTRIKMLWYS